MPDYQAQELPVRITACPQSPGACFAGHNYVSSDQWDTDFVIALLAVNFFLGIVGVVQVSRIVMHNSSKKSLPEQAEAVKEAAEQTIQVLELPT